MRINAITQPFNAELRKTEGARKTEKEKAGKTPTVDRSDISSGAQRLSETKAQFEVLATSLSAQSDIRNERIAEVKARIENGYYNSEEFIDKLAEKLLKEFGIKGTES